MLKGGFLLEERLGARSRATRDVDVTSTDALEVDALRAAVASALATAVDEDGFVLRVTGAHPHVVGDGSGIRLSVSVDLAGRPFATVRLDVVSRPDEVAGGTEVVTLTPVLTVPGWSPVTVTSVDLGQHVAEKLHPLCTLDAHSRPSTRVKDLVGVVLLVEACVLDEPHAARRLHAVFAVRGTEAPTTLPIPPVAWHDDYGVLVRRIDHEPVRGVSVLQRHDDEVTAAAADVTHLGQALHQIAHADGWHGLNRVEGLRATGGAVVVVRSDELLGPDEDEWPEDPFEGEGDLLYRQNDIHAD